MNLYLISRTDSIEYDQYDSAVVCAKHAGQARRMHPSKGLEWDTTDSHDMFAWTKPENVRVKKIGITEQKTPGVILASFNAG